VWAGVYTEEQAKRGEVVAAKLCTSCHGPDLTGGEAGPALVGLEFIGNWTNLTMADFFDRVHSTMPADSPGTMTPQQTSDVSAYVLKLNKYPAGTTELSSDLGALKAIKIEGPR
jgi:mono/diheme cytochrome c family protein